MTDATAGVADDALKQLLSDHWQDMLRRSPVYATELGEHRYDDRIGDPGLDAVAAGRRARDQFLDRAIHLDRERLTEADRVTLELFTWELASDARTDVCRFETWSFSPTSNPVAEWNYLPEVHTVATVTDGRNLVTRYRAIPAAIDATIANLRGGLAEGRVGNATSVGKALEMADAAVAQDLAVWPLLAPGTVDHPDWDSKDVERFRRDLHRAVEHGILPAYQRWADFLRTEVLPIARTDDNAGLKGLPDGDACYRAVIERHTTLPLEAADLHATGLAELARIHAEFQDLGEKQFGTRDLQAIFEHLRTDPDLRFGTADEVEAVATDALARAQAAVPQWFGIQPKTACVVRRTPDYEAPYSTIAYYRPPHPDGTKPGEYFVNTYAPVTRPRQEALVLAFHESVPGHHLQIAIAQELPLVPAFRTNLQVTAYVEGWALYTESLADEMGLYKTDLDRLGKLSFDAWRAARLVVDTGLHDQGWSRAQAEQFMLDNTPLASNNVHNEVDRYLNWPGQALAYKTGQLEISALRREAEVRLGARFDIKGFHDVVLGGGPVTLGLLRTRVDAWTTQAMGLE